MRLIIAEKPSLARNIAAAIGNMKRTTDYFEGGGYLVTWLYGHLFTLCDVEEYTGDPGGGRWTLQNLPCFPAEFRFRLRTNADKQPDASIIHRFDAVKKLCNRADVDAIINAGDADREGEIIVRLCIRHALAMDKPVYRLWLPDQTPETVTAALGDMAPDDDYDALANEGFARTYIDWLYGVNLTRFATLKTGTLLRVGRVIVPIVKAIYDRDTAIRNFVPDAYFALVSKAETNGEAVELTSKFKFSKDEAEKAGRACKKLNAAEAFVTDKKTKKDSLKPPKLFSLSKLQSYLGKKFKMPMEKSLSIAQKLYEDGYLTYPRTNSEYLATAEKEKVKKILQTVAAKGYPVKFRDGKAIFDDSKIESHSALTPTYKIPDANKLSPDEKTVYSAVLRRFVAVFCSEECLAQKTELTISVGTYETHTLRGTVILQPGWTKFDDTARGGKILPALEKGDRVNIDFRPVPKETNPPKHYTIETLNNYLKNPFREEKAAAEEGDDSEDYRAIFEGLELGTEATRTGIIENAIKSRYIALKKDVYTILPGGEFLIEALSQMQISMDKYKTGTLGQALKKVYHGEIDVDDAVILAEREISAVFSAAVNDPENAAYSGFYGDTAGVCPLCGRDVLKSRYGFQCAGSRDGCTFRFGSSICKRPISLLEAKALLRDGKTEKLTGFTAKNGNTFAAVLEIKDGEVKFNFD